MNSSDILINEKKTPLRVLVGMSGGVDSSVAAALLKEQGHEVVGVTMKTWRGEDDHTPNTVHACYGPGEEQEIEDAWKVAETLGIPLHVIDLSKEYEAEVLEYFRREYLSGRTPNPCLRCNRRVKFDALLRKVVESGLRFDCFATGHYARIEYDAPRQRYLLKKGKDPKKDQSYFLSFLSQEQLGRSLFPIGTYTKEEVRNMAARFGLPVKDKAESQDFCSGGHASLLPETPPGPILDRKGVTLGEHHGIAAYTIGQRKGLGISVREPRYVTAIDPARNALIVGSREELYRDELFASELNWIAIERLDRPTMLKARIRYLHKEAEALVTPVAADRVHVKFSEPQMSITPGQTVVFYLDDTVVGAGTIERD